VKGVDLHVREGGLRVPRAERLRQVDDRQDADDPDDPHVRVCARCRVDVIADPDAARRRIGVAFQEAGLDIR